MNNEVKIGNQVWMKENLGVDYFLNGDPIPQAKTDEEWKKAGENKQPAWCYYENDLTNGAKYGKLYNWYAVNDSRGLAPKGWHVPTDNEWKTLTNYLGGIDVAGSKMKSTRSWIKNLNGSNESGFSALMGGHRCDYGTFYHIRNAGYWWSSTEYDASNFWLRILFYNKGKVYRNYYDKAYGISVRCLKD